MINHHAPGDKKSYIIDNVSQPEAYGDGNTALMRTVLNGHMPGAEEAVEVLIENKANKNVTNTSNGPWNGKDAFEIAWLQGYPKIATKYFMMSEDPLNCTKRRSLLETDGQTILPKDVFDGEEINLISTRLANVNNIEHLMELAHYAGIFDFHFDLFINYVFPKLAHPTIALNKTINKFFESLQHRCISHPKLVLKLVHLAKSLKFAIRNHPLERVELEMRLEIVEQMLADSLKCDAMDEPLNIQKVLCQDIERTFFKSPAVQSAQAFSKGPMKVCLENEITSIFSTANIAGFLDEIFRSYLKSNDDRNWNPIIFVQLPILRKIINGDPSKESEQLTSFRSNLIHGRYSPFFMFFAEAISKITFLFLISATSMAIYSPGVAGTSPYVEPEKIEKTLYVFVASLIIYEVGQLCDGTFRLFPTTKSILEYFEEVWNVLDLCGLVLVLLWIGSRQYNNAIFSGLLPPAAVFYSFSLLRYLSVGEELGKLVIMIFAMILDMSTFAIVYLMCVFGFTIAIWALFSDIPGFETFMDTFLSLCVMALGGVDFGVFKESQYNGIGVFLIFFFTVFTAIILINLVVARMSATHDKIDEKAYESLQFDRANSINSFLLIKERHPLCMLPAPLNLISCAAAPVHWFWIWHRRGQHSIASKNSKTGFEISEKFLSVAGTVSDITLGVFLSVLAPIWELVYYNYSILRNDKLWGVNQSDSGSNFFKYMKEIIIMNLVFPIFYPLYVLILIVESFDNHTTIVLKRKSNDYSSSSQNVVEEDHDRYLVFYPLKDYVPLPHERNWHLKPDVDKVISIKVIRCANLFYKSDKYQTTPREVKNPILKFRFGKIELTTPESISGSSNPNWPNTILQIPLKEIIKMEREIKENVDSIDIAVFDRDPISGKETHVVEFAGKIDYRLLLSNLRLEGAVDLGIIGQDPKTQKDIKAVVNVAISIFTHSENENEDVEDELDDDDDEGLDEETKLDGPSEAGSEQSAGTETTKKTALHHSKSSRITHGLEDESNYETIEESKVVNDLQENMDIIFQVGDMKKIFEQVDQLKDNEFERDYKVSCQRALKLVKLSHETLLFDYIEYKKIAEVDNEEQTRSRRFSVSKIGDQLELVANLRNKEKEIIQNKFLVARDEYVAYLQVAHQFLTEQDVSTGVSGPFWYEMETVRLESILELHRLNEHSAFEDIYLSEESNRLDATHHLPTGADWKLLKREVFKSHLSALRHLKSHLATPVEDSNFSDQKFAVHVHVPIKDLKLKIQKDDEDIKKLIKKQKSSNNIK